MTTPQTSAAIVGVAAMSSTLLISPQAHAVTVLEPGHTKTQTAFASLGAGLAHAEYTPLALPTAGRVNFGITLRITETTHLIAQASIDQDGRLAISAIGPKGQILGATDTPFTVQAGQRIVVESETIGNHRGTFRVRAWPQTAGVQRPNWQLDLTGQPLGAPTGQTTTYQSLSVSAAEHIEVRPETRWVLPAGQLRGGPAAGDVTAARSAQFFTTGGQCSVNGSGYRRCGSNGTDLQLHNLTPGMQIVRIRTRAEEPSTSHIWHVRPNRYGDVAPTMATTGIPAGRPTAQVVTGTSFGALDGDNDPDTITITETNKDVIDLDDSRIAAEVVVTADDYRISGAHFVGSQYESEKSPGEWLRTETATAQVHVTDSHFGEADDLRTTWSPWRGKGITLERVVVAGMVTTDHITQPGVTIRGSYLKNVRHQSARAPHFDGERFIGNRVESAHERRYRLSTLLAQPTPRTPLVKNQKNWLPEPWVKKTHTHLIPRQATTPTVQASSHRVGVLTNVDLHHLMLARSAQPTHQTSCLSVDERGVIASRWFAQCCAA